MSNSIPNAGAHIDAAWPQKGFSLIELMVVVAILAILGMIALPQYQSFSAKAKLAAALEEISVGTRGLDLIYMEGGDVWARDITAEDIGLPSKSKLCVERYVNSQEFWCVLKPDPVMGQAPNIGFLRNSHTGKWTCSASVGNASQQLVPEQCRYRPGGP